VEALYNLIIDRLNEIQDDWESGDFSLAGMFKDGEREEVFQKSLAARLEDVSREVYQVAREVEVFNLKMPDIRIFRAGVGIVTIEIKIANKWSYSQHRNDALKGQLIEKYMRYRRSRHGVLVLINLKKGREWQPPKEKRIDFKGLVARLNAEAEKIVSNRGRSEMVKVI